MSQISDVPPLANVPVPIADILPSLPVEGLRYLAAGSRETWPVKLAGERMGCLRREPLWLSLLVVFCLASCSSLPRDPVPPAFADNAAVIEGVEVRYWGDRAPDNIDALAAEKWAQVRATRPNLLKKARPQINFLAISGGGSDGAFGAGLLVGWTARGDRPEFDIVTGISTGALTAPFAFLGPRYDPALKAVYTTYSTDQLVTKQPIRGLLGGKRFRATRGSPA